MAFKLEIKPQGVTHESKIDRATAGSLYDTPDQASVSSKQHEIDRAVAEAEHYAGVQKERYPGGRDSLKHPHDIREFDRLQLAIDAAMGRAHFARAQGERQLAKERNPQQGEGEVERSGKTVKLQFDK